MGSSAADLASSPHIVRRLSHAIDETIRALAGLGLEVLGRVTSPIRGQKGNLEELAAFRLR